MITKETARRIYNCYQQIEGIDRLKKEMLEEVEKASNEKSGDNSFSYKGFIEGVEWRINSVWHTNKVKPTSSNLIIRKSRKDEHDLGYDTVVWAYIKDLIPNVE